MEAGKIMKNVIVVSHERSGTHFLINTIAMNYGYNPIWRDCPEAPFRNNELRGFIEENHVPSGIILKSHHHRLFFDDFMDRLTSAYYVLYIKRHVCDVMLSCFRYFNVGPSCFPHTSAIAELLSSNPTKSTFDKSYSHPDDLSSSMVERWYKHVTKWENYAVKHVDRIAFIEYEKLFYNFEDTAAMIGRFLGQNLPKSFVRPKPTDKCIYPDGVFAGSWEKHFTSDDMLVFTSLMKEAMK